MDAANSGFQYELFVNSRVQLRLTLLNAQQTHATQNLQCFEFAQEAHQPDLQLNYATEINTNAYRYSVRKTKAKSKFFLEKFITTTYTMLSNFF